MASPTSHHLPSSARRGVRAARLRTHRAGFTLMELMAVVVIVGILAAIAVPGAANRFRENRAQRAANEVASLYRNARMRAMGRGAAVLVRWDAGTQTFRVLEAIRGGADACAQQPEAQCRTPLTRWQPGAAGAVLNQSLGSFSPSGLGAHTTTVEINGVAAPTVDICFSPMGTTFLSTADVATNPASVLVPMADIPVVRIQRAGGGLMRRVLFLPNGAARVSAEAAAGAAEEGGGGG